MAMFQSAKRRAHTALRARPTDQQRLSILAAGTRMTGELETDGVVRVEGKVEGELRGHGQVLVAPGGAVQGDIAARQVIVQGEVRGRIVADELVELQAGCLVYGDITAPRLAMEEGGTLNGFLRVAQPEASRAGSSPMERTPRYPTSSPDGNNEQRPATTEERKVEALRSAG